ncbi:glycosyltransferase family 4 protein [Candidatus Roizmanbacteria bacterium]|nr:glycosyltransferase family 4 protein [Candidatus Roizmanbacteria bacterium]
MIIGVDGNEANVSIKVGVSVYTSNLLKYFKSYSSTEIQFKVFLRRKPSEDLPAENTYYKYEIVPGRFLWSQIFLPLHLYMKKNIDVFFSPAHYAPRFCPVSSIITIHDLSYLYYPQDFLKKDLYQLKNWTKYSIQNAKKIIAVSKTTKKDIVRSYEIQEGKVEVVYNGYERKVKSQKSKVKTEYSKNPYILYVGTLQPRKNIATLIQAFAKFKKLYPKFKLIIAGKKGWLYDQIFNEVSNLRFDRDIHFTDYVTDQQLTFLYKNAFCFVLPSFYEGFGIPILEAMSFGCPVISSFASSLPEVGNDACLYFNPTSVEDLLDKLKEVKENSKLRNDLIHKGKERVKEFSWKKCGEQTLSVIQDAAM